MQLRTITYRNDRLESRSGHIPVDETEDGVYLHRDDVCDLIKAMGPNRSNDGAWDLPTIATAVPAWIAERLRLLP